MDKYNDFIQAVREMQRLLMEQATAVIEARPIPVDDSSMLPSLKADDDE